MGRINEVCCEDCSRCELLSQGRVDMVTCCLDQLFRKVKRIGEQVERLANERADSEINFVANEKTEEEE